jgi:putative DNA primase/helicase
MSLHDDLRSKGERDKILLEKAQAAVHQWPPQYHLRTDGFFADIMTKDGTPRQVRLCEPFLLLGELSSTSSGDTGILITFKTSRGQEKTMLVPMSEIHGTGLGKFLAIAGMRCDPGKIAMDKLKSFFATAKPRRIITSVTNAGWHEVGGRWIYLRPNNQVFGTAPTTDSGRLPTVMLQRGNSIDLPASEVVNYGSSGTLEEWQQHVAKPAIGNSRLAFMQAAAFAGAIMRLAGIAAGGVHLFGGTSSGKTISMIASASVWGRPVDETATKAGGLIKSWNTTPTSLETLATENNDSVTLLDEIAELNARDLKLAIYSLGNGAGKRRSTPTAGTRDTYKWSTFPVSTGEVPVAEMLEEDGQSVPGGVEVRLLNLPADAGHGLGVLDHHTGASGPGEFLDRLRQDAARFYGVAGPCFLEKLAAALNIGEEGPALLRDWAQDSLAVFIRQALGDRKLSSQVMRSAATFALVAAAGEIAIRMKILPWPEGEATRAATACLNAWLGDREQLGDAAASSDDNRSIASIRLAIAMWGESRFHRTYGKDYGKETGFKADTPTGDEEVESAAKSDDDDGDVVSTGSSDNHGPRWGYSRDKAITDANAKPVLGSDGKPTYRTERQYLIFPAVWRQQFKISVSRKTLIALMIKKGYLDAATDPNRKDGTRIAKVDGKAQRFIILNQSIMNDD